MQQTGACCHCGRGTTASWVPKARGAWRWVLVDHLKQSDKKKRSLEKSLNNVVNKLWDQHHSRKLLVCQLQGGANEPDREGIASTRALLLQRPARFSVGREIGTQTDHSDTSHPM